MKDVCCLSRPRRDRALSRGDKETAVISMAEIFLCREEDESALVGDIVERISRFDEVALDGVDLCDVVRVDGFIERFFKRVEAEIGECRTAFKNDRMHSWKSRKNSEIGVRS